MDARSLPRERVHWELCRKYGIECTDKWYDHQPLPTAENGDVRITWDMTIYTDKVLKHKRLDITVVHKDTQKWTLIGITVPADQNITRTEEEKVEKYQELTFEIRRIHGTSKFTIIPVVIGALGSISKGEKTWFGKLDVPDFLGSVQLSAILGNAHLMRKVLPLTLDEKMDLHQICTVQIWCKDIPTQVQTISKAGKVHICYNICIPM